MRMYLDDFFGVFVVVVVFVWLLGRFGCPSGWVPTYLGQLWMTLDNNNNNNIHSMVVGDVGSSGSRYVNVRRDLPRLLFFVPYFFAKYTNSQVVGFLENSFSVFLFLISCDRSRVPFSLLWT